MDRGAVLEGRYEVLEEIGVGSLWTTYKIRHRGLRSVHVLKVLHPTLCHPDFTERFIEEGRIQARFQHPNIVSVTDIITIPVPALVMEFVQGPPLSEWMEKRGRCSAAEIAEIMLPVLDAIGFGHAHGVVHRDLQPSKIRLQYRTSGVRPLVSDFGFTRLLDQGELRSGRRRSVAGVRADPSLYRSPEQIVDPRQARAPSDLFSLGTILYELVTGKPAFDAESEYAIMRRILKGDVRLAHKVAPGLTPTMSACIHRAIAIDPEQRYKTAGEFSAALSLAIHGEPGSQHRGPSLGFDDPEPIALQVPVRPSTRVGVVSARSSVPDPARRDNYLVCQGGRIAWRDGDIEHHEDAKGAGTLVGVCDSKGSGSNAEETGKALMQLISRMYRPAVPRDPQAALTAYLQQIHGSLREKAQGWGLKDTGVMLGVFWFVGQKVAWATVGSPRAYVFHAGELTSLGTGGPSLAETALETQGIINGSRDLGDDTRIHLRDGANAGAVAVTRGDRLVLCTKGVFHRLKRPHIKHVLATEPDAQQAAIRLIEISRRGSRNPTADATVVVLDID